MLPMGRKAKVQSTQLHTCVCLRTPQLLLHVGCAGKLHVLRHYKIVWWHGRLKPVDQIPYMKIQYASWKWQ